MKFSCDSRPFAYAVNKCTRLARPNSTFPITRNVLIESNSNGLYVSATDQVSASVTYRVSGVAIDEHGSVLVDAGSLAVFLNALGAEVSAQITKAGRFLVKSGSKKISLRPNAGKLWMPEKADLKHLVTVVGSELGGLMSTSFMCMKDDPFKALSGMYFLAYDDMLYSIATTHSRIAYSWLESKGCGRGKFLLPQQTASLLSYYLEEDDIVAVSTSNDGKRLWFQTDRFTLSSAQLDGNYPYDKIREFVLLDRQHEIKVDITEFGDALQTCFELAQVERDKSKRVDFHADLAYHLLTISTAEENELGDMEWPLTIKEKKGKSFKLGLYSDFLEDILKAIDRLKKTNLYSMAGIGAKITIGIAESEETLNGLGNIYLSASGVNSLFIVAPMKDAELIDDDE